MALRGKDAATRAVPIKLSREESVSHMASSINNAATRDVPNKPSLKEFVTLMAQ